MGAEPVCGVGHNALRTNAAGAFHRAFPDLQHAPATIVKRRFSSRITLAVISDFFTPEFLARAGPAEKRAIMAMPEAPVNKDYSLPAWQDEIGLAREPAIVNPEPEAECVKPPADDQFRFCVRAPDRSHIPATGGRIVNISQGSGGFASLTRFHKRMYMRLHDPRYLVEDRHRHRIAKLFIGLGI